MESDNAISSNKQFENVCRTCFSKVNLVDFCAETNDYYELSYLSMFTKYLNIEVTKNDSINKICVNCLECLQIVHAFVTTSKKAERCMQSARDNNITVQRPALEEDDDHINFDDIKNVLQFKMEQINKFFDDIEVVLHPPIINNDITVDDVSDEESNEVFPHQTNDNFDKISGDGNKKKFCTVNTKKCGILKDERILKERKEKQKQIENELNAYYARRNKALNLNSFECANITNTITDQNFKMDEAESRWNKDKFTCKKYLRFICKICSLSFTNQTELLKHDIVHSVPKSFAISCKHCNIKFNTSMMYRIHCRKFHKFRCKKCRINFELSEQLTKHQAQLHKLQCNQCDLIYMKLSELRAHKRASHPRKLVRYIVCEICGSYMRRSQLLHHMQIKHTTYTPLLCEDCGKYFNGPQRLRHHRKRTHPVLAPGETPPVHECTVCNRLLKTRSGLLTHISRLHAPATDANQCVVCYKSFPRESSLRKHMTLHTGIRPYACEQCNATYSRKQTLDNHMQRTHNADIKRSEPVCTICNRSFTFKTQLAKHLAEVHEMGVQDPNNFTCHYCTQIFTSAACRSNHIVAEHKQLHPCKVCNKRMSSLPKLRAHMQYHTGVFTYNCTICPKGFAYKQTYETHLRRHKGEHTHICKICGKGFFKEPNLKEHVRVHTNEKPYACDICGKRFSIIYNMKKHRELHTGTIEQCKGCLAKFRSSKAKWEHMANCLLVSKETDISISETSSSYQEDTIKIAVSSMPLI